MCEMSRLEPHHIGMFRANGFLTLDRVISNDELDLYREVYDRLMGNPDASYSGFHLHGEQNADGTRLPQILEPSKFAPELLETQYFQRVKSIAQEVLGTDVSPRHGEHMIYKPPLNGAVTRWHQDQRHQDPALRYRNVNVWLTLDDVTLDSGCMHYVPGSHLEDRLFEEPEAHSQFSSACPLPAGGCTIHASYVLHYSGPNTSTRPRRAYILIFRAQPFARDKKIEMQ